MDRNKEKLYFINCTPNEFYLLIYWACEGVDNFKDSNGWRIEEIEDAIDKISEQVNKQNRIR